MDVQIGEVSSTVRAVDTQALLSPQLLEQITRAVIERMRAQLDHERRAADERQLRPAVSARESTNWG